MTDFYYIERHDCYEDTFENKEITKKDYDHLCQCNCLSGYLVFGHRSVASKEELRDSLYGRIEFLDGSVYDPAED